MTEVSTSFPIEQVDDRLDAEWVDPFDTSHHRQWILIGLLLFLTLASYFQTPLSGLVWTDPAQIRLSENYTSFSALVSRWFHPRMDPVYQPVTATVNWLEYKIWEGNATLGYHLLGMLAHLLNTFLLWRVLKRLEVSGAIIATGLFGLHPVAVQSVAWISQQSVLLSAMFALASMLLFLRWQKIEPTPRVLLPEVEAPEWRRWAAYAFTLVFFLASILSNVMTCALPLVLLLVLWWKRGTITRRDVKLMSPFFVLALAVPVTVVWEQVLRSGTEPWPMAPMQRIFAIARGPWFHLGKLLVPSSLLLVYGKWNLSAASPKAWLTLILTIACSLGLYRARNRMNRGMLVALATFVLLLAPSFALMPLANSPSYVADYQQYLARAAILALLGAALCWLADLLIAPDPGRVGLATVLFLALGILTWRQTNVYANDETAWRHTLMHNPKNHTANVELGALVLEERPQEAADLLRTAVDAEPDSVEAVTDYARALERLHRFDDAEALYNRLMRTHPPDAMRCQAALMARRGDIDGALAKLHKAVELNPLDDKTHNTLGTILAAGGRLDEAMDEYREAAKLNPRLVDAHLNLAQLLFTQRKFDESAEHLQAAVRIDPGNFHAYMTAGGMLMNFKRFNEASRMFRQATRLRPRSPEAWNDLGCSLVPQGMLDESIEDFNRSLDAKADFEPARANLNMAKRQRG